MADWASSRKLSEKDWIDVHASGTLRHARDLDTRYKSLYMTERVAFTFGRQFQRVPASWVTYGPLMAEGDCHAFTEALWEIRRRRAEHYPGDEYSIPYSIRIEQPTGEVEEGIGLFVKKAQDCDWLNLDGFMVVAIIATVKNRQYTGEVSCL